MDEGAVAEAEGEGVGGVEGGGDDDAVEGFFGEAFGGLIVRSGWGDRLGFGVVLVFGTGFGGGFGEFEFAPVLVGE